MTQSLEARVAAHYERGDLLDAILAGLEVQGVTLDRIKTEDLAPVDEFHTAGRATTLKALDLAPIEAGMHILDAGCGIGGTARHLAVERACRVTGIDLTPDFISVAKALTERMGLSDHCRFQVGSATDLPSGDAAFDGVVTFHMAMNIPDRVDLYRELARVTKPNGFLCLFDVMKGPAHGMRYPVPWAETGETSFLKSRDETAGHLDAAGFEITAEQNLRVFAMDFFETVFAKADSGPPPLGLHLLTGDNTADKFANYVAALNDHQIEPVIIIAEKRA